MNPRALLFICLLALLTACDGPWVLVVNSTGTSGDDNPGDGLCQAIGDPGDCTLQAAIDEANAINNHVSIEMETTGTYFFSPSSDEGLLIEPYGRVIITGASNNPSATVIRALPPDSLPSRVFTVRGAALELNNLTIRGGHFGLPLENSKNGGGIIGEVGVNGRAYFLKLENCIVEDNEAKRGGGVYAESQADSRVLIFDTIIRNNTAFKNAIGGGGGLDSRAGYLGIANTLFEGNIGKQGGATIAHVKLQSEIFGSTFYNNEGYVGGGVGIFDTDASVRITRSTFSTNEASGNGGGLYASGAQALLKQVTVTENLAMENGRGIYSSVDSELEIQGTIIGENYSGGGDEIACGGDSLISNGYNVLSGDITNSCNFQHNILTDQVGVGPGLADYTPDPIGHHPVEITSPALDASENLFACDGFDQIGNPVPVDGDGNGMANCDAGAVELQLAKSPAQGHGRVKVTAELAPAVNWDDYQRQVKAGMLTNALGDAKALAVEYRADETKAVRTARSK